MADPIKTAALAERIGTLLERSSRLWAGSLDRSVDTAGKRLKPDPLNAVPAMSKIVNDYIEHPQKAFEASARYWMDQAELWTRMGQAMTGHKVEPMVAPARGDKRFKDPEWSDNPVFDWLKQTYLLNAQWLREELEREYQRCGGQFASLSTLTPLAQACRDHLARQEILNAVT